MRGKFSYSLRNVDPDARDGKGPIPSQLTRGWPFLWFMAQVALSMAQWTYIAGSMVDLDARVEQLITSFVLWSHVGNNIV